MSNEMSTKEIYDLLDKMRMELGSKIEHIDTSVRILTQSFNDLEAGRLSTLEKEFSILKAQNDVRIENNKPYANLFWEVAKYIAIAILAALITVVLNNK